MKPSEIVAKFKEVLLSASDEVELQEPEVKEEVEMMPEEAPKAESVSKEDFDKLKENTLLKTHGMPEDIVEAVIFLLESDFITGEIITVDGGENLKKKKYGI